MTAIDRTGVGKRGLERETRRDDHWNWKYGLTSQSTWIVHGIGLERMNQGGSSPHALLEVYRLKPLGRALSLIGRIVLA